MSMWLAPRAEVPAAHAVLAGAVHTEAYLAIAIVAMLHDTALRPALGRGGDLRVPGQRRCAVL
mgnify:CR=1 FL=1